MDYSSLGASLLLRAAGAVEVVTLVLAGVLCAGYCIAAWHTSRQRRGLARWMPHWH